MCRFSVDNIPSRERAIRVYLKVLHLEGDELIRRYLLHVLPPGLLRIRHHYSFLANCCRAKHVAQIRKAIAAEAEQDTETPEEREPKFSHRYRARAAGPGG